MFLSPKIIIFHYLKCYKQNWIFWQRAFPENVKFYKYSFKYWKILFMYYAIMHAVVTLEILVLHFLNILQINWEAWPWFITNAWCE